MSTKGHVRTNRTILAFVMVAIAILAAAALSMLDTPYAFAEGEEAPPEIVQEEGTPAEVAPQESAPSEIVRLPRLGNDYMWAGQHLDLAHADMPNDLLAAGQTIQVADSQAQGSLRAAGQLVDLTNVVAHQNITVAGETVTLKNSQANAVAMAGRTAAFAGSCSELHVYASDVLIDGTVEGDVHVGADMVTVGSNTRIKGTLYIKASSEPVMQRGAEVANVEYTQSENNAPTAGEVSVIASGLLGGLAIVLAIASVVGTLIIAVLAEWLFGRHTEAAAHMIRTRTGATIGSGVISAFVAPVAVIITLLLVVTLPVAGALIFGLVALSIVAGGFAGASLSKLVFPKLGHYAGALVGGAIIGLLEAIPILGGLASAVTFMYLLGYVIQSVYLNIRKSTSSEQDTPPTLPTT